MYIYKVYIISDVYLSGKRPYDYFPMRNVFESTNEYVSE